MDTVKNVNAMAVLLLAFVLLAAVVNSVFDTFGIIRFVATWIAWLPGAI